jgi:esterase/lipase superfamily enzyme
MGGAAVGQAIAELERDDLVFDQIVLAAPDIDADVFREQLLPKLARHGRRTTLYCSKNDLALRVSYAFNDMYRAGDSSRGPLVAKDLDTVDASEIDTDLLGHSYYGDAVRLLDDVALIMKQNLPPTAPDRRLRAVALLGPVYWVFGE